MLFRSPHRDDDGGVLRHLFGHRRQAGLSRIPESRHVAIVTLIAAAHLGFFRNLDEIAQAKAEIFEGLEPDGAALLNRDDSRWKLLDKMAKTAGVEHEQNAVMGRANRALAGRVDAIAGGFLPEDESAAGAKTVTTGNPVRPQILEAAKTPYVASAGEEPFRFLVFGGSQGAQFFSDAVPAAIGLLPEAQRKRLMITQQARAEDVARVKAAYAALGVDAQVSPFFTDMRGIRSAIC